MYIKKFSFNPFGVNTYICWDDTKECVIIDAGCHDSNEEMQLASFIEENNLRPVRLLNTHGHFDHIMGNRFVNRKWNLEPEINREDIFLIERSVEQAMMFGINIHTPVNTDKYLSGDEHISFGDSSFKMIHVPGHSPGSIVFYSEDAGAAIVGDVLFNGSIGRADLPGGNYGQLISGIKEKLFALPDETVVYSGHGEETTIGMEKKMNPYLQ